MVLVEQLPSIRVADTAHRSREFPLIKIAQANEAPPVFQWEPETYRIIDQVAEFSDGRMLVGTGIENCYPFVRTPTGKEQYRDILALTGFRDSSTDLLSWYGRYMREEGYKGQLPVRFGDALHQVNPNPGEFSWEFTDRVFDAMQQNSLTPVMDFIHFGLPQWWHRKNSDLPYFQNPDLWRYAEEYASAFVRRYPHIRFYTPVNEPMITANFSSLWGKWNERLQDESAFLRASANIAAAGIAIHQVMTTTDFEGPFRLAFQNESLESFHALPGSARESEAAHMNWLKMVPMRLMTGMVDVPLIETLLKAGVAPQTLNFILNNATKRQMVLGLDYYAPCEKWQFRNKKTIHSSLTMHPFRLLTRIAEYYEQFKMPMFHMEVNGDGPEGRRAWQYTWSCVKEASLRGYPIVGASYFSLNSQVGWLSNPPLCLDELEVNRRGLIFEGEPEPVAPTLRWSLRNRPLLPTPFTGNTCPGI